MQTHFSAEIARRCSVALLFAIAFLAASVANIAAQTGIQSADRELAQWRSFSPPNGRFAVSLPAPPESVVTPISAEETTLDLHGFMSKTTASVYLIAYLDYAAMPKDAEAIENAFDAGRDRMLAASKSGGALLSEKKITVNNYPAREFAYQNDGGLFKTRMILVRERGYILQVATPLLRSLPEVMVKIYQAEADKFFNSFEILDNKKK